MADIIDINRKSKLQEKIEELEAIDMDAVERGMRKDMFNTSIINGIDYTLTDSYDFEQYEQQMDRNRLARELLEEDRRKGINVFGDL